ncbi:hypothetical protein V6Z11_A09G105400 [Gossypium hirsutum]|uniref:Uncharacterized protein n=1 Tax=Gossypium hirsutum TaxID=3635 RepID=A0A1U8HSL5_GOSHI|nr:uncharacterized protein LOC107889150 [Gossypium hirsutum]
MPIHLHRVGLFEPEGILARNPSSTSISTKKGEENHGSLARCGCAGAGVAAGRYGAYGAGIVRRWWRAWEAEAQAGTARVSVLKFLGHLGRCNFEVGLVLGYFFEFGSCN